MNNSLDFGSVFERTFDIYKTHFKTLLMAAAVVFGVVMIVGILFGVAIASGSGGAIGVSVILLLIVAVAAGFFYQGLVVRVVQHDGDDIAHSLGQLFDSVKPVLVPLILTSIMAGLFMLLGFICLVIPGLILMVHFAVIAPVVVIENKRDMDAIKRSWNLVKGNAWIVFAIVLVLQIGLFIVGSIIGGIGMGMGDEVGREIGKFVVNVLLAPLPAIAGAVMYFQLAGAGAPVGTAPAPVGGIPAAGAPGAAPAATASSVPPPPPPSNAS